MIHLFIYFWLNKNNISISSLIDFISLSLGLKNKNHSSAKSYFILRPLQFTTVGTKQILNKIKVNLTFIDILSPLDSSLTVNDTICSSALFRTQAEINKNFMANLNKNEKVVNELTSVNEKISYFNCKLDLFLVMMIAIWQS